MHPSLRRSLAPMAASAMALVGCARGCGPPQDNAETRGATSAHAAAPAAIDRSIELFEPDTDADSRAVTGMDIALSDEEVFWIEDRGRAPSAVRAKRKADPRAPSRIAYEPPPANNHVAGIAGVRHGVVALTTADTLLFIGSSQRILATLPPSLFRQIIGADDGVYIVDDERLVYVGMDGVVRALANAQHGSNVATHGDRVVWLATPDRFGESQADPAAKASAMSASTSTPVSSLVALSEGGSPIPIAHDLVLHDFSVATDGTHAWFTSQRAIRRVALVGEPVVTTVHEEELFTPGHLLLASDDLYFTVPGARGTTILHVKKGGGRPSAWVDDRHVLQMVADGRHVYWLTHSGIHRKARAPTTDE